MKIFGVLVYKILIWPGVIVHEFSHFIGALITFTPVRGFSLIAKKSDDGEIILGKVTHDDTANPFKQIIISTLPFFGGALAIWILAYYLISGFYASPPIISISTNGVTKYAIDWITFAKYFVTGINFSLWQSWLFLYLAIAISAHLAPSNHDLWYALGGIVEVILVGTIIALALNTTGIIFSSFFVLWAIYLSSSIITIFAYIIAIQILVTIFAEAILGIKSVVWR
ncbi:MAG: hypothetical protein AAB795_01525 [Patescibacteria group bacterium]